MPGLERLLKISGPSSIFRRPNQFIATMTSNHLGYNDARMAFLPGHDTECCTGNVNRFMPYYIEQMWLRTKDDGIAAALFGPGAIDQNVSLLNNT